MFRFYPIPIIVRIVPIEGSVARCVVSSRSPCMPRWSAEAMFTFVGVLSDGVPQWWGRGHWPVPCGLSTGRYRLPRSFLNFLVIREFIGESFPVILGARYWIRQMNHQLFCHRSGPVSDHWTCAIGCTHWISRESTCQLLACSSFSRVLHW